MWTEIQCHTLLKKGLQRTEKERTIIEKFRIVWIIFVWQNANNYVHKFRLLDI